MRGAAIRRAATRGGAMRGAAALRWAATALLLALTGCELAEVTVAEPVREVVAEAYVRVGIKQLVGLPPGAVAQPYNIISVLLHETLDAGGKSGPVKGARVRVTRPSDGRVIDVFESPFFFDADSLSSCALTHPPDSSGTCYATASDAPGLSTLASGDRLSLRIDLADGRVLTSEAVIPSRFELLNAPDGGGCVIAPRTNAGLRWSRSASAWAYIADTYINGLSRVFPVEHVDPLYLLGLSVSAADTAIAFPREFGVFSRGDLDHDLSTALQVGLPDSTSATVAVTAIDRNWVNWARGAGFNPSGQVRVPSVRGDGTGVFGVGVVRSFRVVSTTRPSSLPRCPEDAIEPTGD